MPMPHRTFAQVAKRRLQGTEGSERVRVINGLLAELPDYRNGPVRRPAQVAAGRARPHPHACQGRAPRLAGRATRGSGAGRARRRSERGQVVAAAGAVRDPDQDGRLRLHDAAARPGADAHPRRAGAARGDPRPDRRRGRRSWRWQGAPRRAAQRRRDRLLSGRGRRPGRAAHRPGRGRCGRDREARAARGDEARRCRTGRLRPPRGGVLRPACARSLGARRGQPRSLPRCGMGPDRADPRLSAARRPRSTASPSHFTPERRSSTSPTRSTTSSPPRAVVHTCGGRRHGSTVSASAATTRSPTATRSRFWARREPAPGCAPRRLARATASPRAARRSRAPRRAAARPPEPVPARRATRRARAA